jgi:hypothetical protein
MPPSKEMLQGSFEDIFILVSCPRISLSRPPESLEGESGSFSSGWRWGEPLVLSNMLILAPSMIFCWNSSSLLNYCFINPSSSSTVSRAFPFSPMNCLTK